VVQDFFHQQYVTVTIQISEPLFFLEGILPNGFLSSLGIAENYVYKWPRVVISDTGGVYIRAILGLEEHVDALS